MLDHDLDELRAAKQRIGVAYAKARDVTGARMRTLDGMLADAMRLCVGSMPATQAKILASYAARFERMAERRSPAGRRGTRGARERWRRSWARGSPLPVKRPRPSARPYRAPSRLPGRPVTRSPCPRPRRQECWQREPARCRRPRAVGRASPR